MLFGIPEIQEYEKTCTDPYVLAIIKRLWVSHSTNARQQEYIVKLENENLTLRTTIECLKMDVEYYVSREVEELY